MYLNEGESYNDVIIVLVTTARLINIQSTVLSFDHLIWPIIQK